MEVIKLSSLSLYRKWRPKKFSEVVGQDHVKETLKNAVDSDRISHAYLFTGSRGIGKTTIARIFAKAVNCQNPVKGEPEGKCPSCEDMGSGKSLDLIEIDGASNRGIDEIRDLREKIKFTPHNNEYKVFIIDEVHMLTKEAFNALLKTLEEPPKHAIFILATTESHKIPETVLSRCQRFNFSRIKIPELVKHLKEISEKEKIKIPNEAIYMIASYSEGSVRDAISMLDQVSSFGNKKVTPEMVQDMLGVSSTKTINDFIKFLVKKDSAEAFATLNKAIDEGIDMNLFADTATEKLRTLLYVSVGNENLVQFFNEEEKKLFKDLAESVDTNTIVDLIEKISDAKQKIKYSIIPELPIELIVAQISDNHRSEKRESNKENSQKNVFKKTESSSKTKKENKDIRKNQKKGLEESVDEGKLFSEIQKNWNKIIDGLKSYNHSIALCLKTSVLEKIEDGHLVIGFDFPFHKEKIQQLENKQIVEDKIAKEAGSFIPIRCTTARKRDKVDNHQDFDAQEIFEGEIIE